MGGLKKFTKHLHRSDQDKGDQEEEVQQANGINKDFNIQDSQQSEMRSSVSIPQDNVNQSISAHSFRSIKTNLPDGNKQDPDQSIIPQPSLDQFGSPKRNKLPDQDISCTIFNKNQQPPAKYQLHITQILQALFLCGLTTYLFVIKLLKPGLWSTLLFSVGTVPVGFLFMYLLRKQQEAKVQHQRKMNVELGVKGLRDVLGFLPTWISFTDEDKAEWMNQLLEEMWPYYDKAICETVKDQVEPIMEQFRPPGLIKKIGFKQLTFGDAPFRVEAVRVDHGDDTQVELEMDIRWAGEASIVFAIEPAVGGDLTRMCPKLTDLTISARLRIILKPLVPVIPCFGAILASLKRPPILKYRLDFGKALGGSALGSSIKGWLDGFIQSILGDMLVWPRRFIVPMFDDPDLIGPLEELEQRTVGLLKVVVHSGHDIPKMDAGGKADPVLVLYTGPLKHVETSTKKNTLEPEWEETFYLTVEEPKDQVLRLEMFDVDVVRVSELFKGINVVKNMKESFGAREFIGRSSMPIALAARQHGTPLDSTHDFGCGEWGALEGPGRGRGQVKLTTTYRALDSLDPASADRGMVILHVYRCNNLQGTEGGGLCDPYCTVSMKHKETYKTPVVYKDINPEYNASFTFYDVEVGDDITVKVIDYDPLTPDEELGKVKIPVYEASESKVDGVKGLVHRDFTIGDDDAGTVNLKIRFVPYF